MPKDDPEDEAPKKRPAAHDEEDDDFDREIGESMDEDELPKSAKKSKQEEEEDVDPLDREDEEDLDPELMKAGSKELFPDDEEDVAPAPKPTFKYNVETPTMPPSDDPVMPTAKHTLDDLSDEQQPRKAFQVERGFGAAPEPTHDDLDDAFQRQPRPASPPMMQQEEYEHDNLSIPSIRKQTPIYPPHQSRGGEDEDDYFAPKQPQMRQNPSYNNNPYAAGDGSQRFGYRDRAPKGASKWHIIVLLLIGGGVIAATVYLLQNQFNFPGKPAETSPAPSAQVSETTPVPTATPAPLERSQFKVRVLNGTTEAGIAKKVMDKLKGLGYQSDRTGNAAKQDYAQTLIRVKEGDSTISAQLTKDLAPDFEASISPDLGKDEKVDAEVILGDK